MNSSPVPSGPCGHTSDGIALQSYKLFLKYKTFSTDFIFLASMIIF